MRPLQIVVCMKPVPDPRLWGRLKLDPRTMLLRRAEIGAVINPLDRNAIEQAVTLRAQAGGRITVVSMAPPAAEEQLAETLALGCDAAYLLSDPAFAGADSLATARCLTAAVGKLGGADLIFCGAYSLDGSTSQVGPQIAELLELPDLTHVTSLSFDGEALRACCRLDDGEVVYECELPAVVTFDKDANLPRLPTMRGIMNAAAAGVTRWGAADLAAPAEGLGLAGSPTQMLNVFTPPVGRKGEMIEGSPNEAARSLLEKLRASRVLE